MVLSEILVALGLLFLLLLILAPLFYYFNKEKSDEEADTEDEVPSDGDKPEDKG